MNSYSLTAVKLARDRSPEPLDWPILNEDESEVVLLTKENSHAHYRLIRIILSDLRPGTSRSRRLLPSLTLNPERTDCFGTESHELSITIPVRRCSIASPRQLAAPGHHLSPFRCETVPKFSGFLGTADIPTDSDFLRTQPVLCSSAPSLLRISQDTLQRRLCSRWPAR